MTHYMDELKAAAMTMGISLSAGQLTQFETYYQELGHWNQQLNLTGIVERTEVMVKHFLDSLSCLLALPDLPQTVVDVGSGAGFPGLVLKIAQPHIQLALIEATGKKAAFLEHLVQKLALSQVTVLNERAETIGQQADRRERYHLAVARAIAPLPVLAEYALPLLRLDGLLLAQKGADPAPEVAAAARALEVLGGRHLKTLPVTIPQLDAARHLVLIQKTGPTPKHYPRQPGRPAKKPLH